MMKPCPFCGSEKVGKVASIYKNESLSREWMQCEDCKATGPEAWPSDEGEAEEKWNTRIPESKEPK